MTICGEQTMFAKELAFKDTKKGCFYIELCDLAENI